MSNTSNVEFTDCGLVQAFENNRCAAELVRSNDCHRMTLHQGW